MLSLIVAHDSKYGIGKNNKLPWKLSKELKYFKYITTKPPHRHLPIDCSLNAVIMGRKTWESIPSKFKPLPERLNIILSRNQEYVKKNTDLNIPNTFFMESSMTSDTLKQGHRISRNPTFKAVMQTAPELPMHIRIVILE